MFENLVLSKCVLYDLIHCLSADEDYLLLSAALPPILPFKPSVTLPSSLLNLSPSLHITLLSFLFPRLPFSSPPPSFPRGALVILSICHLQIISCSSWSTDLYNERDLDRLFPSPPHFPALIFYLFASLYLPLLLFLISSVLLPVLHFLLSLLPYLPFP